MFARGNLICGFTQCGGDKTHRGQEAGVSNTVVRTGCRGQNMVQKPEPQGKSRNLSGAVSRNWRFRWRC